MKSLKKAYQQPEIELIKLDNEISLQLASVSNISPGDPFNNPANAPASRVLRDDTDPYQYETW